MKKHILHELKSHSPFTVFGAVTGIVMMLIFYRIPYSTAYNIFYVLHPAHIILGALVTTSMYRNYKCAADPGGCNLGMLIAVGFLGSVGGATISDSIIPYFGEKLLGLPLAEAHIGFIEEWKIILPAAAIGMFIAYYRPSTKAPHAGHVLISTWSSLFHIIMAMGGKINPLIAAAAFLFLFFAVWVPCCASDIVFPLLFVEDKKCSVCGGTSEK